MVSCYFCIDHERTGMLCEVVCAVHMLEAHWNCKRPVLKPCRDGHVVCDARERLKEVHAAPKKLPFK